MAMLQVVGQSLRLGDLEAECRESLTTDGGADASAVDCSPASSMTIVLACSQETSGDTMFCESTCYSVLNPWYEVCQAEMPTYIQAMMAVPLQLMQQCGAGDPAAAVCDMTTLMTVCMADSGLDSLDGEDPMAACANPCIAQILPCADNPMLSMILGADAVASFVQLDQMCNGGDGDAGPGDMVCNLGGLMAMMSDPAMDPSLCGSDVTCTCNNAVVQEMLDCQDDPLFADSADDLAPIDALCSSMNSGGDAGSPGDGTCQVAQVVAYTQDPDMSPDMCGGDLMCLCNNAAIKEMMDCRDDPSAAIFLEGSTDELTDLMTSCAAITGPGGVEGSPGDHVCNEMSASMLCDDSTLDMASSGGMTGAEICSHPCAQEMIDCIDSPLLAENRALIASLQQVCSSEQAECLPIVANMGDYFDEACCTGAGLAACPDGPPPTCTTGCSAMYLPFWRDCGAVVNGLGQGSDDFAQVAAAMENFNTVCTTAHPGKTRPGKAGGH